MFEVEVPNQGVQMCTWKRPRKEKRKEKEKREEKRKEKKRKKEKKKERAFGSRSRKDLREMEDRLEKRRLSVNVEIYLVFYQQ